MSVFDDVRTIPFEDVVNRYGGVPVTKKHTCMCPFHNDKNPSMYIYKDHGYCFACNTWTDNVKLVSHVYNLTPLESARKIAADFGLAQGVVSEEKVNQWQLEKQQRELDEKLESEVYDRMIGIVWQLRDWGNTRYPKVPSLENTDPRWDFALKYISVVDFMIAEYWYVGNDDRADWIKNSGVLKELNSINCKMQAIIKEVK